MQIEIPDWLDEKVVKVLVKTLIIEMERADNLKAYSYLKLLKEGDDAEELFEI